MLVTIRSIFSLYQMTPRSLNEAENEQRYKVRPVKLNFSVTCEMIAKRSFKMLCNDFATISSSIIEPHPTMTLNPRPKMIRLIITMRRNGPHSSDTSSQAVFALIVTVLCIREV